MSRRIPWLWAASGETILVLVALVAILGMPALAQDKAATSTDSPVAVSASEASLDANPSPPPVVDGQKISLSTDQLKPGGSPAGDAYLGGVDLYNQGLYSEALNEFNRALALDSGNQDAAIYKAKCESKLQMQAAGADTSGKEPFRTLDPTSIQTGNEAGAVLSTEELRVQQLKKLIDEGQFYLENQKFEIAQRRFQEALLIDPKNLTAQNGLQKATLGVEENKLKRTEKDLEIQTAQTSTMINDKKLLPEGSDPTGIRPPRLPVAVNEEVNIKEEETKRVKVEKALDSPVSLLEYGESDQFSGAPVKSVTPPDLMIFMNRPGFHVSELLSNIAEIAQINIVLDWRVVYHPSELALRVQAPISNITGSAGGIPGAGGATGFGATGGMMGGGMMGGGMGGMGGGMGGMGGEMGGLGGYTVTTGPYNTDFGGGMGGMGGGMGGSSGGGMGGSSGGRGGSSTGQGGNDDRLYEQKVDGWVYYFSIQDVTVRETLQALLRPLGLDFAVEPGFIWVSKPERIRYESFEELETRFYQLRSLGTETLFKIVLADDTGDSSNTGSSNGSSNSSSGTSTTSSSNTGSGSSSSSSSAVSFSNISDLFSEGDSYSYGETPPITSVLTSVLPGGGTGYYYREWRYGAGEYGDEGGGSDSGSGNSNSGSSSGSSSSRSGNSNSGGSSRSGSSNSGGSSRSSSGGGGTRSGSSGSSGSGNNSGSGDNGGESDQSSDLEIYLEAFLPPVADPNTRELISWELYNPLTNQLILHNTASNLDEFEKSLSEFDKTPKQVSIESKFITISVNDLKKLGFTWGGTGENQSASFSDLGNRDRVVPQFLPTDEDHRYDYDINGDGEPESVPFYSKPDGSNVVNNTITEGLLKAAANPGSTLGSTLTLSGIITDNADGDQLRVTMDYLNSLTETELLSAPRVTTMNRKPAVIADYSTRYYPTNVNTQVTVSEGNAVGGSNLASVQEYIVTAFNFGITLSVTPAIIANDQVRLWLNPQVTSLDGTDGPFTQTTTVNGETTTSTITYPRQRTQTVWTNVIVHDGDTLVLGGLITDSSTKGQDKVPYLADIPLLGTFFKGNSKQVEQSSLLIFVTVDIIDPTGARYFESESDSAS